MCTTQLEIYVLHYAISAVHYAMGVLFLCNGMLYYEVVHCAMNMTFAKQCWCCTIH